MPYPSLFCLSRVPLRIVSTYFWLSWPKPARKAFRPSDVCNRFWTFVASSLPSFRKHCPMTLSSVRFCYAVWKLSVLHGHAIDHRIYEVAERSNVSLAFSPSSSSSSSYSSSSSSSSSSSAFSFLSRLEANALLSRAQGYQQSAAEVW